VLTTIDNQRESVKGVSLNEETVNMIKYQRAFEASARVMTALDEMLDIIINRMGVVGR
jgi:flagellar hook-associated protein 1 FlgK